MNAFIAKSHTQMLILTHVHAYTYVHIPKHICKHKHSQTLIYENTRVPSSHNMFKCTHSHTNMYIHSCLHIHTHAYSYMHTHTKPHTHTFMHAHNHKTHTHMHTYPCTYTWLVAHRHPHSHMSTGTFTWTLVSYTSCWYTQKCEY